MPKSYSGEAEFQQLLPSFLSRNFLRFKVLWRYHFSLKSISLTSHIAITERAVEDFNCLHPASDEQTCEA
jgi:hypothetical protein